MKTLTEEHSLIRSFLFKNVSQIINGLNVSRKSQESSGGFDLFENAGVSTGEVKIVWEKNVDNLGKINTLLEEKNILGLYVSGFPLENLKPVEKLLPKKKFPKIHLILVEKVKKVFTRNRKMMLAMEITNSEKSLEAVVFPDLAKDLIEKISERTLYWVYGSVSKKSKKGEGIGLDEVADKKDAPKLIVEGCIPFSQGVLPLLKSKEITIEAELERILSSFNWVKIEQNPTNFSFNEELRDSPLISKKASLTKKKANKSLNSKQARVKNVAKTPVLVLDAEKIGLKKLTLVKKLLKKTNEISKDQKSTLLELKFVLKKGETVKKSKYNFWVAKKDLQKAGLDIYLKYSE